MVPLVTIALPVYKRLTYVPQALESVRAQDYPHIELLVSDNGCNGGAVPALAERHYGMPYRFRQSPSPLPIVAHFNALVASAAGEYFVLLSDDDELSPDFVSRLVPLLERRPRAAAAFGRVETMDEDGRPIGPAAPPLPPDLMADHELVRAWAAGAYRFVSFTTGLARTAEIRAAGGYPDFPTGNGVDDALLIKLVLGRAAAFDRQAVFRHRIYDTSFGKSASCMTLAEDSRRFLRLLDDDPRIRAYAQAHPAEWATMRPALRRMIWGTYLGRWRGMYRGRMARGEWLRAGFALPPIPAYYAEVLATLASAAPLASVALRRGKRVAPGIYQAYRALRQRALQR